jgi:hypothetical protein
LRACEAARQVIQDRFDREQEEQRQRAAFERRVPRLDRSAGRQCAVDD